MTIRDLVPFTWRTHAVPATRNTDIGLRGDPWDRLFADVGNGFFRDFDALIPLYGEGGALTPRVNVTETDTEYRVTAELPGIDEKDVKVHFEKDSLILHGEKKHETRSDDGCAHHRERSYGFFERVVPLPDYLKADGAKANYKNGVLTVTIGKDTKKLNSRQIPVTSE